MSPAWPPFRWRARIILFAFLAWPVVHMGLSRAGHFSPWRFGGWGMYASAYPTPARRPVNLILKYAGPEGPQRERLRVSWEGRDVTAQLANQGLSFYVTGAALDRVRLQGPRAMKRLIEGVKAARQLDTRHELVQLAALANELLVRTHPDPWTTHFAVGEAQADLIRGRYGMEYTFYSIVDGRARPRQRILDPGGSDAAPILVSGHEPLMRGRSTCRFALPPPGLGAGRLVSGGGRGFTSSCTVPSTRGASPLDTVGADVMLRTTLSACVGVVLPLGSMASVRLPPATSSSIDAPAEGYVLHASGSPVKSDELEYAARLAIEVVVVWGADALCVSHFAAPCAVFVGDASGCDVALPAELLGAERRCVAVSSHSDVCVVLPEGVRGWLTLPDGSTRPLEEQVPTLGRGPTPTERLLPLALGYRAHLRFRSLDVQVATVRLGRAPRRGLGLDASIVTSLSLSALTVASLMLVLSQLTPTLGLNHDERAESARLRLIQTYMEAAAEREAKPLSEGHREPARAAAPKPPPQRTEPRDAAIEDGALEAPQPESLIGFPATAMPARDPIARRRQVEAARQFGIIGMLDWPELSDPERKLERDLNGEEIALMQRLFNPDSQPVYEGPGGLRLGSFGIGGGGKADVIELGAVRTATEGQGQALAQFRGAAIEPEAHSSRGLSARQPESIVSDPLAAATIRRAVQAERTALRDCYRNAQGRSSAVAMSATVRFVVLGSGQIEQVTATHPSLPANVSTCIERVFLGLSVPNPVSRPVRVAYRVTLDS